MTDIQDMIYLTQLLKEALEEALDLRLEVQSLKEELRKPMKYYTEKDFEGFVERFIARINESISVYENMTSSDRHIEINTLKAVIEIIKGTRWKKI